MTQVSRMVYHSPRANIMECKVRWAVGRITMNKASGSDGIPAEMFQILKFMLLKCYTQYASKFGKLQDGENQFSL